MICTAIQARRPERPDRPSPSTALRHWAAWSRDYGSWRQTCFSIEGRYARDQARYKWDSDKAEAQRERYDQLTAEAVEDIVREMPVQERDVLRAVYVDHPSMAAEDLARRMGMSPQRFELLELAARARFAKRWKGESDAQAA